MAAIKTPWRVTINERELNATINGNGGHVAQVWSGRNPNLETLRDNARMIAEAHPMRDALALCYAALTEEGATSKDRTLAIRAARRSLDKTAGC